MKVSSSIISTLFVAGITCHSNLQHPIPRGNKVWSGYCSRGQGCITACDAPKSESAINSPYIKATEYKRGDIVKVDWFRQNHPGGFVRLSMVPFDQSDDIQAFDKHSIHYSCYETDCKEDESVSFLDENNGRGTQRCTTNFTIPSNIPNGKVTLQWMWYGGGIYYAEKDTSFAQYVSCSDMKIVGDDPVQNLSIKPTFDSRDLGSGSKNGECRYWGTNSAFKCLTGSEKREECGKSVQKSGIPAELNRVSLPFTSKGSYPVNSVDSYPVNPYNSF